MTLKVFWQDPYLTHLATRVTQVNDADVMVEASIFYAASGGQESDAGAFDGLTVTQARWAGRELVYTLPPDHGLRPGQALTMEIDWVRRYRLMRLHFAAEIVLELMYKRRPGVDKTGAHIAADKARIDFALDDSVAPLLPALAADANDIIAADLAIVSAFSDPVNERRYWQIEGFAQVPCGGTHLRRSGEVGAVALKRKNVGKGRERIEITLAEGARPALA
ncbi:MAG: alanyl-tRNA editing protein [Rhodocyclaceae bacterium]